MMSRLKAGLSRERCWRGWESRPELCQVCIDTHHVSEWAFYIALNLEQMAYTQWAVARLYCYICMHPHLCAHIFEHGVFSYVCTSIYPTCVIVYVTGGMQASCIYTYACVCLCLYLSMRAYVCAWMQVCGIVANGRSTFALTACPVLSQSVTQWFPAPHSSRPAASCTHCSMWNAHFLLMLSVFNLFLWLLIHALVRVRDKVNFILLWNDSQCR